MKIAVITMHAVKNYGSVLQTYATRRIFEKIGLDVEIINYVREKNLDENLLQTWTIHDKGLARLIKKAILLPTVTRWKKVFGGYLKSELPLSERRYTSEQDLLDHPVCADIFCTGSDQVWNSGWNNGIEKPFYLSFVPDDFPKIALAASIGKETIDPQEADAIRPYLDRYKFITMREPSGLNIVRALGIKNSDFCLDPTLLLSREEWLQYAKLYPIKKKYVLIYQLNHDSDFDRFAVEFARRKNLELIRVCTRYDQKRLPGRGVVLPEVRELLSLINNAEYVLTNSFHATAFCINLNKQFISIDPNEYSSRLNDALEMLGLEQRKLKSYEQYDIADTDIEFEAVNQKLLYYREQSNNLIKNMIDICKESVEENNNAACHERNP